MIYYNFDIHKSTQAAALFLKLNKGMLNYMKLIKLLYLLDRATLAKWNEPVTGDSYFALRHGPIVSNIKELIDAPSEPGEPVDYWHRHIDKTKEDVYSVTLLSDPGDDELSDREVRQISEIDAAFKDYDQWDMVRFCHDTCAEWERPGMSSFSISVESVLRAIGKTDEEIAAIQEEAAFYQKLNSMAGAPN